MASTYTGPTSGTNLGPLTTTFTAPASCGVAIVACKSSCSYGFQGQRCAKNIGGAGCADARSCWPSATISHTNPPFYGFGFYSPGTICPSGYSSACTATAGGSSGWSQQFSMSDHETAVGCCPSGFGCAWDGGVQSCYSVASSGATVALGTCESGSTQQFSYATFPNGGTTVVQASTTNVVNGMDSFTVQAPLVEIRWKSSDLPASATSETTPSSTASSISNSDSSSGLSTGAIAAIAVVIPVVAIAALVGAFLLWRRRKKSPGKGQNLLELDGSEVDKSSPYTDKKPAGDRPPLQEMESNDARHEMGTEAATHELEGDRPSHEAQK